MPSSDNEKMIFQGKGLGYKLLIIEALIFVLPFFVISYVFYGTKISLDSSQVIILALTLILILAGLILLRQIFDRFFTVSALINKARIGDKHLRDLGKDTDELDKIIVSFHGLMKRFEETTRELRSRVFELFAIRELIEIVSKSLDIDDLLDVLLEKAMAVSKAQIGTVLMVESEKGCFRVMASRGLESGPKKDSYIRLSESLAKRVVSDRKPLFVQGVETDSRIWKPDDPECGPASSLSMPIFVRENLIAILTLSHGETEQIFDSNDEQILSIMIGEMGFALENAQLHSRIQENLKHLQERTDELTNANDRLRQEVTERKQAEEAFRKAKADADAANMAKNEFLANMSHEIRTPMNAVTGFADMLLDTRLNKDQMDHARTIKRNGEALLSLIDDILDLSKIEAGKLDFEETEFDPELLSYDVCDLITPKVGSKPVETLCRIGDNIPPSVRGDPLRFRQVLTNLMSNAAKFTESGEIELALDVEEEKDDRVKFHAAVRDTGIGIPDEKMNTIFEAFQQADGSSTRKYEGTGLGLAISKKISKLMHGDVWAESEVNKGSIFHFTGWLGKPEDKEAKGFTPVSLSGKKALIVDDNEANRDILTHVLEMADMHVVALTSGEEVISTLENALAAEDPFDISIVDIQMPGMSGYEVAKRVRKWERGMKKDSNLPLMALSSVAKRDAKRCEEAGFNGFLTKPLHREKLFKMLERIIGERQGEGEKDEVVREKIITQYSVREDIKHSVRILLAEDNPVNQKLAKTMLTKAGYQVEVAGDGMEAVEKFTESPEDFDLIFMDVQMPEMDGFEATAKIREKELELATRNLQPATRIPIIAMTAHALKGDKEKCLDAGMNDYISKPIKREVVFEILRKWVLDRKLKGHVHKIVN